MAQACSFFAHDACVCSVALAAFFEHDCIGGLSIWAQPVAMRVEAAIAMALRFMLVPFKC